MAAARHTDHSQCKPLPFKEGDVLLVCDHIASARGHVSVQYRAMQKREFVRDDGTTGICDCTAACRKCVDQAKETGEDPPYIEMRVKSGKMHMADLQPVSEEASLP